MIDSKDIKIYHEISDNKNGIFATANSMQVNDIAHPTSSEVTKTKKSEDI